MFHDNTAKKEKESNHEIANHYYVKNKYLIKFE